MSPVAANPFGGHSFNSKHCMAITLGLPINVGSLINRRHSAWISMWCVRRWGM